MSTAAAARSAWRDPLVRRLPVGAEPFGNGVHFRVWAPAARKLAVVLGNGEAAWLEAEGEGHFSASIAGIGHGTRYRYRLDDGDLLPDPVSRCQPEGPAGPSMVIDPDRYRWRDQDWRGVPREGQVLYELHVGAFTPEGTWRAAAGRLPQLAEIGITCIEMMPVNEFAGRFGWGYDGASLFAPYHHYGEPDDLRFFVDEAHRHGLGVILDVVYNHLGPGSDFLRKFSKDYFNPRYDTDWGEALNFDGENCAPVREWVVTNGIYWVDEFHMDGFRIDATQNIYDFDESREHILAEFTRRAREAAGSRTILVVGENEPQITRLIRPRAQGGYGLDALWNDDFHHSAIVALTGRNEAYLTDHRGSPQEFVSAAKHGFLYQGQRYRWQDWPRGTPTRGLEPCQLVNFTQNHDQLANMGRGYRAHHIAGAGRYRAITALMVLMPGTPMYFMGQEFGASQPFHYFLDVKGELADMVDAGRRKEVSQFPSLATPELQAVLKRPDDPATFAACKLDWAEFDRHHEHVALNRDLLRLRREDPTLRFACCASGRVDGAVLGPEAFVLRYFGQADDDRLLLVNLGIDLELTIMPEPLLAPPEGTDWTLLWSSEHPDYGGIGAQAPAPDRPWVLPGHAALLLRPGAPWPGRKSELEKALDKAEEIRARRERKG
ncbi:malto-oligosyltrehalose trehalohydrolase [Benzoatithermus flavus]|uniref:Malto-oligosyltrehalose trehalohydrolase n=1 Tax=Benzoatithermus flavus TaxID=3108223 RepID=A0ABU8XMI3_9PROT